MITDKEEWRPVVGYEGLYEVSNFGRVKSLARKVPSRGNGLRPVKERILIAHKNGKGYMNVILCLNGKTHKHGLVHRLVAEAFIPNPEGKPNIDHIDCDPLNNCVWNLRWCTQKENCNNATSRHRDSLAKTGEKNPMYGKRNEQIHNARKVACFTKDGEYVATYPSASEAERQTGIRSGLIRECALGKVRLDKRYGTCYETKSAGGYIWRYI